MGRVKAYILLVSYFVRERVKYCAAKQRVQGQKHMEIFEGELRCCRGWFSGCLSKNW